MSYTPCKFTAAVKNYSHLEKEALGIVIAVQKFHNYIYGRQFIIESDHYPLSYILQYHLQPFRKSLGGH